MKKNPLNKFFRNAFKALLQLFSQTNLQISGPFAGFCILLFFSHSLNSVLRPYYNPTSRSFNAFLLPFLFSDISNYSIFLSSTSFSLFLFIAVSIAIYLPLITLILLLLKPKKSTKKPKRCTTARKRPTPSPASLPSPARSRAAPCPRRPTQKPASPSMATQTPSLAATSLSRRGVKQPPTAKRSTSCWSTGSTLRRRSTRMWAIGWSSSLLTSWGGQRRRSTGTGWTRFVDFVFAFLLSSSSFSSSSSSKKLVGRSSRVQRRD